MGFGEPTKRTYVTILDGKLAIRSDQDNPKAVKRTTKAGNDVWEVLYPNYTGVLKDITFKEREHEGKKWEEMHLLVVDGNENVLIQIPFPSRYANSFLRAILNADFTQPMTLTPWYKVVGDKTKAALYISQGDGSLQWFFGVTPETANGLPDLVPYTIPGDPETKYSDVQRNKFFKELVELKIKPILKAATQPEAAKSAGGFSGGAEIIDAPDHIGEPVDDLPF